MSKVKINDKTLTVGGGKEIVAENLKGFKDGEKIVVFKNSETCKFKYTYDKDYKKKKHVAEGTVVEMHVLDAAIAEELGKGTIVK
jgi:hypothetical protein